MLVAIGIDGKRIFAEKNKIASCPYCNARVDAYCGEINTWHWRHHNLAECDLWKEPETLWHLGWKMNFHNDWREVIIIQNREKHIADIKTDSGLVLELQNSSISSTTIQERERFYGNMCWLINAEPFKKNIILRSVVSSKLRALKREYDHLAANNKNVEEYLDEYKQDLKNLEKSSRDIGAKMISNQSMIDNYQSIYEQYRGNFKKYFNSVYTYMPNGFKSDLLSVIQKIEQEKKDIEKKILNYKNKVKQIDNYPTTEIESLKHYKVVHFNEGDSKYYKLCKVVNKSTMNTIWPDIRDIRSTLEFDFYSNQKEKFFLLIDFTETRQQHIQNIEKLDNQIKSLDDQKENHYCLLSVEFSEWLENQIVKLNMDSRQLNDELVRNHNEQEKTYKDMLVEKERLILEQAEYEKMLNNERVSREFEIKKTYKGQYIYNWKYYRRTWDYAECQIFLDFGDEIFQILSNETLRKLKKDEFIQKIKSWP